MAEDFEEFRNDRTINMNVFRKWLIVVSRGSDDRPVQLTLVLFLEPWRSANNDPATPLLSRHLVASQNTE